MGREAPGGWGCAGKTAGGRAQIYLDLALETDREGEG